MSYNLYRIASDGNCMFNAVLLAAGDIIKIIVMMKLEQLRLKLI